MLPLPTLSLRPPASRGADGAAAASMHRRPPPVKPLPRIPPYPSELELSHPQQTSNPNLDPPPRSRPHRPPLASAPRLPSRLIRSHWAATGHALCVPHDQSRGNVFVTERAFQNNKMNRSEETYIYCKEPKLTILKRCCVDRVTESPMQIITVVGTGEIGTELGLIC